jgi:putative N6-adenine-specific DNA methylase
LDFFATAAKGTEGALRDELREIGVPGVRADRGGVHFGGEFADALRACLDSRIAVRILWRLAAFEARGAEALYAGVGAVDWTPILTPKQTLSVRAASRDSLLRHTDFVALKTKDAVVDQLRKRHGSRPSVDAEDPDVGVFVHLQRDRAQVYLDVSGESLHKRGWRALHNEAPLKETLAAAVLRLSGWDRVVPLRDPMCGSGTLAIEASLWACRVAPGLARTRLGIERWALFDVPLRRRLKELRDEARLAALTRGPEVGASDVDAEAVAITRENAHLAGVGITVSRRDVRDLEPTDPPGVVVVNPPYGERLAGGEALYRDMAKAFARLKGHRVCVLAGTPAIERALGRPDSWLKLFNGALECRLLTYQP